MTFHNLSIISENKNMRLEISVQVTKPLKFSQQQYVNGRKLFRNYKELLYNPLLH